MTKLTIVSIPVCGYLAVYNFSQVHPGDNVFASNIAEWGTALFSLSLATNIIVTTLIGKETLVMGKYNTSQLSTSM